jgi:hypothetical protein
MVIKGVLFESYSGGTLKHIQSEQLVRNLTGSNGLSSWECVEHYAPKIQSSDLVLDKDGNALPIGISGSSEINHE